MSLARTAAGGRTVRPAGADPTQAEPPAAAADGSAVSWPGPGRHRPRPHPAGPRVRRAGVLHPLRLDGAHPARRRPGPGLQAELPLRRHPARATSSSSTAPARSRPRSRRRPARLGEGRAVGGRVLRAWRRPSTTSSSGSSACPGDSVVCCTPPASSRSTASRSPSRTSIPGTRASAVPFNIVVPAGRLWVMGDHRADSADSRAHLGDPGGGTVPEKRVIGKVVSIYWPLGRIGSPAGAPELARIPAAQGWEADRDGRPRRAGEPRVDDVRDRRRCGPAASDPAEPVGPPGAGRDSAPARSGGPDVVRAAAARRSGALGLLRETVLVVGIALVLSLVIKTFLVQAFYIPSGLDGEHPARGRQGDRQQADARPVRPQARRHRRLQGPRRLARPHGADPAQQDRRRHPRRR